MCEVTRHNFKNLLPEIEDSLRKSTFVAIDCEFSGLLSNAEVKNSLFDNASERYIKLKESISQFIILQIGITCFKFIRDWNEYKACVYRFYIFPRSFGSIDARFLCQSSSFEFLCSYNFDFNKVIYDGVSYLNKSQEASLIKELESGALFGYLERSVSLDDEKALQSACSTVGRWVLSAPLGDTLVLSTSSFEESYTYLLHNEIRNRFKNVWTFNNEKEVHVKRISDEERKVYDETEGTLKLEHEFLEGLTGFSKVFKLLTEIKKPIVGHNLFLDLLIMYNQFYEPLPASIKSFKKNINKLFPVIYDTKFISYEFQNRLKKEDRFSSNSLGNLYDFLKTKGSSLVLFSPKVTLQAGFYEDVDEQQIHEAGWDSYITGFCFVKIAHILAANSDVSTQMRPLTSTEHFTAVTRMKNRVNIVRATLSHLNLEGEDPVSTRPPLLHVSGKGREKLSKFRLAELFAKYGAVDVKHTSPNTALIAVSNFSSVRDILKDFRQNRDIKVEKFKLFHHSPTARRIVWAGVVIPFGIGIWIILQSLKK